MRYQWQPPERRTARGVRAPVLSGLVLLAALLAALSSGICHPARAQSVSIEDRAAAIEAEASVWEPVYGTPVQCVMAIAQRETGGTFLFDVANDSGHYGPFQFGTGEESIWSKTDYWQLYHLEPYEVPWPWHVQAFTQIAAEHPEEARSTAGWYPWPADCP